MVSSYAYYSTYSTQYKAVIDKAISLGYTLPSVNQQKFQDIMLRSWIASGAFAKADLLYVFANDAGLDFARINWKNPNNFLLTNIGTEPMKFLKNYGAYATTEVVGAFGGLDPGWTPATSGSNFSLNNNCVIHSTQSFYGACGFPYRCSISATDAYYFYSLDFARAWANNSAAAGSGSASHNNFHWMNRRTAATVTHIAFISSPGVVTLNVTSVVASSARNPSAFGITCDLFSASSTLSLGMPLETLFVGSGLTDTEFINYDNALTAYFNKIRYVTGIFTSGNYTVPAGITELFVECWGAGGAGRGYPNATQTTTGGGGGGGAYAASIISVTPGQIIPVIVPGPSAGGTGAGVAGGDTSWNGGVILAKGGQGAPASTAKAAGGLASASTGTIKFNGGSGGAGGGALNASCGAGGSGAGSLSNGLTGVDAVGGQSFNVRNTYNVLGPGSPGYSQINTANVNGLPGMLGSGGSGARRTTTTKLGGNGGQGYIRISAPKIY